MSRLSRISVALGMAVAIAAIVIRVPSIVEPLGIDQGEWASIARLLARGQTMYTEVWDQKPPGIFFTYLATFEVLGWRASSVAWMDLLASAATTMALFAIGRRLRGLATGVTVAALYAALTVPSWLYGHGGFLERSVNETFISLGVTVAAWFAARAAGQQRTTDMLGLGLFSGAAVVFKPNAGIYFVALAAWWWIYRVRTRDAAPTVTGRVVMVLVGASIIPCLTFIWLWRHGLLAEAWVASVAYNLGYVSTATPFDHAIAYSKAIWLRMKTDPLWMSGGIGALVVGRDLITRRRLDPLPALAACWGAAAALAIYANGIWLFNSYFVQALPPLALLGGWLLTSSTGSDRVRRAAAVVVVVLGSTLLVTRGYVTRVSGSTATDVRELRGLGSHQDYLGLFGVYAGGTGYSARANEELERYIASATRPDDRIFLFGINAAEAYFGADRMTGHRFLRANYFIASTYPDPRYTLEGVVQDLQAARPTLLVFEQLHSRSDLGRIVDGLEQDPGVMALLRHYRAERRIEDFSIYRRVD